MNNHNTFFNTIIQLSLIPKILTDDLIYKLNKSNINYNVRSNKLIYTLLYEFNKINLDVLIKYKDLTLLMIILYFLISAYKMNNQEYIQIGHIMFDKILNSKNKGFPNEINNNNQNALYIATKQMYTNKFNSIINDLVMVTNTTFLNDSNCSILMIAIMLNNIDIIEFLILHDKHNITHLTKYDKNNALLIWASALNMYINNFKEYLNIFRYLINDPNININYINNNNHNILDVLINSYITLDTNDMMEIDNDKIQNVDDVFLQNDNFYDSFYYLIINIIKFYNLYISDNVLNEIKNHKNDISLKYRFFKNIYNMIKTNDIVMILDNNKYIVNNEFWVGNLINEYISMMYLIKKYKNIICTYDMDFYGYDIDLIDYHKNINDLDIKIDRYKDRFDISDLQHIKDNIENRYQKQWKKHTCFRYDDINNILEFNCDLSFCNIKHHKYIAFPLTIYTKIGGHANMLIYNIKNRVLERFEPNGYVEFYNNNELDRLIKLKFKESYIPIEKYYNPDFCPKQSFQYKDNKEKQIIDSQVVGFCSAWSIWYLDFRLSNACDEQNIDNCRKHIVEEAMKQISQIGFRNFISNYSKMLLKIKQDIISEFIKNPSNNNKLNINKVIDKYIQPIQNLDTIMPDI